MKIDLTPLARPHFLKIARRTDSWASSTADIQEALLRKLLRLGARSKPGRKYGFAEMATASDAYQSYSDSVPLVAYEDIRMDVMRMIAGEADVLWPGVCRNFAQSSGTSGGKSKFVPITDASLSGNHYRGAEDAVAHYLRHNPGSRLFSGKGFILGGSFAHHNLRHVSPSVRIGDLSATLINKITPLANFFRVPDKATALLPDWEVKLPALVARARRENITNISGVPSWFLTVIRSIVAAEGKNKISEVWPNLEVFFHGGISFEPYREEYRLLCDERKMHFVETYNASEGFFAVQDDPADRSMLLIIDRNVFYEFLPADNPHARPLPIWEVKQGEVYELILTSSNGLWRYHLGDTVRIEQINPVKIRIVGRTKSFINAFGEELMEDNAERAMAAACTATGAAIRNYTAAPLYAHKGKRGRHQWLVEWEQLPDSIPHFAEELDRNLRLLNSDYDAKRTHTIFLDPPEIITASEGLFDRWLKSAGTHKLGGQRKIPRLRNDRKIIEQMLEMLGA